MGGVIEEQLRIAGVEGKRVVDHHEIHIGVAPIDQRIAEQEKRCRKACDNRRQSPSPAEEGQPVEGILRADVVGLGGEGRIGKLVHAGGLLERFQAKWKPVRVKKTRQIKNLEPRFDSIETENAAIISGQSFQANHFSDALTATNLAVRALPMPLTEATMTMLMPTAIMLYSIAVAPVSS